jgi:hypothetical protein
VRRDRQGVLTHACGRCLWTGCSLPRGATLLLAAREDTVLECCAHGALCLWVSLPVPSGELASVDADVLLELVNTSHNGNECLEFWWHVPMQSDWAEASPPTTPPRPPPAKLYA